MALTASIYKALINLSNLDTHQYEDFNLTLAKHPSENEDRMMFRVLAFLYCAHEKLEFTKGLSNVDEPELWQKDYSGEIVHWIELGLPDEKRIRQSCAKSKKVTIFTYHPRKSHEWFEKIKGKFASNDKLHIYNLEVVENGPLDQIVNKSMNLSCMIEEDLMHLSDDQHRIGIKVTKVK